MKYLPIERFCNNYKWKPALQFQHVENQQSFVDTLIHMCPIEYSGFVLSNAEGNKTYIQSPAFSSLESVFNLPRQVVSVQPRHFLLIAREQLYFEKTERGLKWSFGEYFPQWETHYTTIYDRLKAFVRFVDSIYIPLNAIKENKDFASSLKQVLNKETASLKPLLFSLRNNNMSSAFQLLGRYELLSQFQLEKHLHLQKTPAKKSFQTICSESPTTDS